MKRQDAPHHKKEFCKCRFRVFAVFTCPFEQTFQVVADRCHQQAFACEFYYSGVDSSHPQEVHQGADHRFDSGLSQFLHTPCFAGLQALVHLVIEVFVHRVFDLFTVIFADAGAAQRTMPAVQGRRAVDPHPVGTIMRVFDALEGQFDASFALVIITTGKVAEAFPMGLYWPKLGM